MNKKTRSSRYRKKRGYTRKHRGGGGCFGGICSPNITKVEQPGTAPVLTINPMVATAERSPMTREEKRAYFAEYLESARARKDTLETTSAELKREAKILHNRGNITGAKSKLRKKIVLGQNLARTLSSIEFAKKQLDALQ